MGRELEWAAVAFENESRERDAEYRTVQTQRVQNVGEIMHNMQAILGEFDWLRQFNFGNAPEQFFVANGTLATDASTGDGQGQARGEQPRSESAPNDTASNREPGEGDDFEIRNERGGTDEDNREEEAEETIRETPAPAPENTEEDREVEKEKKMIGKFKEMLGRGIAVDTSIRQLGEQAKEELKQEGNDVDDDEEEEENDIMSLVLSEMTTAHGFQLMRGDMGCFDETWPKIKARFQDLLLKLSGDEDALCEQLLSCLNTKIVKTLRESGIVKPEFDLDEVYLQVDHEFLPRFQELLLGEYRLLVRNQSINFMQNFMNPTGQALGSLPPQIQNLMSGNGAIPGETQAPYFQNEHLPLFSKNLDDLLIEYWGKLAHRYSQGIEGGFEALKEQMRSYFQNYMDQFMERHGFGMNLPVNVVILFDSTIGVRIEKGYQLEERKQQEELEVMRMLEKIECQTLKTTPEEAAKELSTEYKKGDLMKQ